MTKKKDDQDAKEIIKAQAKAAQDLKRERDLNHKPYRDKRGPRGIIRRPA